MAESKFLPMKDQPETRDIVTPYAFAIPAELIGIPLARPWKRATAMLLDLTVVALLSLLNVTLLALAFAVIFWRASRQQNGVRKSWQTALRLLAAVIIFLSSLTIILWILEKQGVELVPDEDFSRLGALGMVPALIQTEQCTTLDCWRPHIEALVQGVGAAEPDPQKARALLVEFVEEANLGGEDKSVLQSELEIALAAQLEIAVEQLVVKQTPDNQVTAGNEATEVAATAKDKPIIVLNPLQPEDADTQKPGVVGWIKAFIEELGLGFGWAAFYFSALGQGRANTLGKQLLGIRVIQLNGQPIGFWNAFGRYGGYAAGLATGLLGFLQVYWDPNRQAIQDKIAATVVIDTRRENRINR